MPPLFRLFLIFVPLWFAPALAVGASDSIIHPTRAPIERDDDMSLGDPKAPIVLIEYASLTCPHCAAFHKDVFPALIEKYVDTGKMRLVFRQLPTPPVPFAVAAEAIARCKGPDTYFDLLEILYEAQTNWIRSENPRQALMDIAARAGINEKKFEACISDESNINRIKAVYQEASDKYKVGGTPSFVLNGVLRPQVMGRPFVLEDFSAIIEPILASTD
jgi:protein-disulfide isomerase